MFLSSFFMIVIGSLDAAPIPAKRVCLENNGVTMDGGLNHEVEADKSPALQEINLVKHLEPFIKYVKWESTDADYFLKTVRGHNIMTEENENAAMAQMLQSFIDTQPLVSKNYRSRVTKLC